MRFFSRFSFGMILVLGVLVSACSYYNPEELDPFAGLPPLDCATDSLTYDDDIIHLLWATCKTCHQQGRADGGVSLSGYEEVLISVDNGSLLGSLDFRPGYSPMPPSGEKWSDCNIEKMRAWIQDAAPE